MTRESLLLVGALLVTAIILTGLSAGGAPIEARLPAHLTTVSYAGSSANPTNAVHPLAISLSENGIAPTLISLTWTASTDFFFTSYEVVYSPTSSSGPWYEFANITTPAWNYVWGYGASPGSTYYWQEIQWGNFLGYYSSSSNILQETQPSTASLSYTQPTQTSVMLSWTNSASYGGNVSFGSYDVNESVNGGVPSTVASITSASTLSYTINGLSTGTNYSFYIETIDQGNEGSTLFSFPTYSNSVNIGVAPPLVATASVHPSSVDAGQQTSFSCVAIGGTGSDTFTWAFGNGATGTGQTTSYAYPMQGSYTATCTVTDSASTTAQSPVLVTVSPAPSVSASVNHGNVSPGTQVVFTATASGGPGTFPGYAWNFGDGTTGSGATTSHTYGRAGDFQVTISVTDGNGVTATNSVVVTVSNLSITASVTHTSGVPGTSFDFTAAATGGGGAPYTYSWEFGDGTSGTGSSTTHAYTSLGNYTANVKVTDSLGGTNVTTLATVRVFAPLTVQISVTDSNPSPGTAVTLTAQIQGGSSSYICTWQFGDSNSGTGCSVAHSWATSGSYTVNLTVTDPNAGTKSTTTLVTVAVPTSGVGVDLSVGGMPLWVWIVIAAVVAVAIVGVLLGRRRGGGTKPTPPPPR